MEKIWKIGDDIHIQVIGVEADSGSENKKSQTSGDDDATSRVGGVSF